MSAARFHPTSRKVVPGSRFATTHWSVVLAAGGQDDGQARDALEALCRTYWYPLYAFARRKGLSAEDAADLIQEFFAYVLEKSVLAAAEQERGRFRTFLLTVLQRFLAKQHERARAQKRGGGRRQISIDAAGGEDRYRLEPSTDLTPERIYERRWALTLLEQVLEQLQQHYAKQGRADLFARLRPFLTGGPATSYATIAAEMDLSESAVKVAVHRLRKRYRKLLREEVARTVDSPDEVDQELDHLLAALRGGTSGNGL